MPTRKPDEFVVAWPTLGFLVADWIQAHCIISDGFRKGDPFVMYDWQLWCTVNHYRVKPTAAWRPERPMLATAFHNRRSQVVAPQKTGKGPWTATAIAAEARGPVLFAGWAEGGEQYVCSDHGCDCGWWYEYEPGEPMGMQWPTPLIQLLATSEDQTENVYRHLKAMCRRGPLAGQMRVGEEFIRLPNDGQIDIVTSSAQARLGNPITFAVQDETGLYTATNKMITVAETMRRGLAGMGGRAIETTNAWNPAERSTAQRTAESPAKDIFRFYREPPTHLSYRNKAERRKIHRHVYAGSTHVDLDAIEGEAFELLAEDPAQAERFFGNRIVVGDGSWMEPGEWTARKAKTPRIVEPGTPIVFGFDGSDTDDWTVIRAETEQGHQFTPTFSDGRPMVWNPEDHGGQVPRLEVMAAVDYLFTTYNVVRSYWDPPYWSTEIDECAERYGEKRVIRFSTFRVVQMHAATERLHVDVVKTDSGFSHDGCPTTELHVRNARKSPRTNDRYVLTKPSRGQKIDACVTSVICHEAACDVTAAGLWPKPKVRRKLIRLR